jgi:hypothetical protein
LATEITISAINWGNSPTSAQTVTLEYKLWSSSSWTTIDSGVNVDTDGSILDSPLPNVTGLTEGELYYIRAYNECSSPIEYSPIESFNT